MIRSTVRLLAATALLGMGGMASAQQAAPGQPPQRIRSVTLTGDQKCPPSSGGEIVVCSRAGEPYRIPPALRDSGPIAAPNQSWANRAADGEQTQRVAGGLPNTCSPVGTGGQSGCALQANRAWAADKRARVQAENQVP